MKTTGKVPGWLEEPDGGIVCAFLCHKHRRIVAQTAQGCVETVGGDRSAVSIVKVGDVNNSQGL
jgi:hypothetical protein